jgi:anti-sigma B factor antagonist
VTQLNAVVGSRPDLPPSCVVLTVDREVDLQSATPFRAAIAHALARRPALLIIDLGQTTFLDSTGLNVLVLAHKAARVADVDLELFPGPAEVTKVLEVSGIDVLFRPRARQ